MTAIPTVCADHLTPAQVRAYVIADNRLAELAGWDRKLLAIELRGLSVELDFDVALTGFEIAEADSLITERRDEAPDEADAVPGIDWTRPAISQPGDLWRIGDHYLLCGDALDRESYQRRWAAPRLSSFLRPRRPCRSSGPIPVRGKSRRRDGAMASDGTSESDVSTPFLRTAFARLCAASADLAIHAHSLCMDWRRMRAHVLDAAGTTYTELKLFVSGPRPRPERGASTARSTSSCSCLRTAARRPSTP